MNSCEITQFVTVAANCIAKNLTGCELDLVASIFMQLSDTLTTIAVVRDCNEKQTAQIEEFNK